VAWVLALACAAVAWALEPGIVRADETVLLGGRGAEGGPGARSEIRLQSLGADDLPMMHQLFGFGVDPVLADSGASGALAVAVSRNDEPAARLLLESGTDPDDGDLSPLEKAVRAGTKDMVGLLIQHGADLNVLSREGQPMMPLAVALGRADITAALLDAGADVDTPVVSPASEEFVQLVPGKYARFYLTRDQGLTPLMIAVLRGDLEMVRMLLKRGASPGPTRGQVKYPLGMAADRRNVPMMQVLLGRDPDEAANARRIVISIRGQQATLYEHGEPTFHTRVSTGRKGYPTPHGEYVITDKRRIWQSTLYDAEMPYFMRLSGSDIGLHAGVVPRGPASHGCIRLPAAAARNLYQRMRPGDPVTIAP
jgi:lipoprotein-anchoring transpeptidase ErfK/SrfK